MLAELFGEEEGAEDASPSNSETPAPSSSNAKIAKPWEPRLAVGFVGLENQGATCYLNALIQGMYMTPDLRMGLYRLDPHELGFDDYEEHVKEKEEEASNSGRNSSPNEDIVQQLMVFGFSENGSKRACIAVNNSSLDNAMDWALNHSEDENFNAPVADPNSSAKSKRRKPRLIPLELQRLFTQLQHLNRKTISTQDLTTRGFQWQGLDGRVQHDAHELNRLLIDALDRSLAKTSGQNLVKALYEGLSANQTQCLNCGSVSEREEKYFDLMVQVKDFASLAESLRIYVSAERLSGEYRYECSQCYSKQDALRTLALRSLPPILSISLNRFEYDMTTYQRVKINDKFEFPLVLDMSSFAEGGDCVGKEASAETDQATDADVGGPFTESIRSSMVWVDRVAQRVRTYANAFIDHMCSESFNSEQRLAALTELQDPSKLTAALAEYRAVHPLVLDHTKPRADSERSGANIYDLFAVIMHRGGAYSGHYHAFIRDTMNEGHWSSQTTFLDDPSQNSCQKKDVAKTQLNDVYFSGDTWCILESSYLAKLVQILQSSDVTEIGLRGLHISEVGSKFKLSTGQTWAKLCKQQLGALPQFLTKNESLFLFDGNTVCLNDVPIRYISDENYALERALVESGVHQDVNGYDGNLETKCQSDEAIAQALQKQIDEAEGTKIGGSNLSEETWTVVGKRGKSSKAMLSKENDHETATENEYGDVDKLDKLLKRQRKAVLQSIEDIITNEEFGRWFNFDDRSVKAMSVTDIDKAFQGKDSAYLLVYRARTLPIPEHVSAPTVWLAKVNHLNSEDDEVRARYDHESHEIQLYIYTPSQFEYRWPLLLRQGEPLKLTLDSRQTVTDLKALIWQIAHDREAALPSSVEAVQLHELKICGDTSTGGYHPTQFLGLELDSKPLGELLRAGAEIIAWDGCTVRGLSVPAGLDCIPLKVKLTLLGRGQTPSKKSLPPIEVVSSEDNWIPSNISEQQLCTHLAATFGMEASHICAHMMQRKGSSTRRAQGSFELVLLNAKQTRTLESILGHRSCEIIVEHVESRGMHTKSLADTYASVQNQMWSITVENGTSINTMDDDLQTEEAVLCADKDITVGELKLMALEHFKIDATLYSTDTRLRRGADRGVDVLSQETISLENAGLKDGSSLTLEKGAPPRPDRVFVRFCVVRDNDPSPRFNPEKPGTRDTQLEVEVGDKDTVVEVKERMRVLAGLSDSCLIRIRKTNWHEEAENLVCEYEHGNTSPLTFKASVMYKAGDTFLLEEGRVPCKGDVTFMIFLWDPTVPTETLSEEGQDEESRFRNMKKKLLIELPEVDCVEDAPLSLFRQYIYSMLCTSDVVLQRFPGPLSMEQILVRDPRQEILPGRIYWDAFDGSKTLKRLGLKGQKPVLIQILPEAVSPPSCSEVFRVWVQRRLNPLAIEGPAFNEPLWPPMEVCVDGGIQPNMGHLKAAVGSAFGLAPERIRIAKYLSIPKEWTELTGPKDTTANPNPNPASGAKRAGRRRKGQRGGGGKKTWDSILQGPSGLKEGDLLAVIDIEDVQDCQFSWDRPEDICARAKMAADHKQKKVEKKKRRDQPEVALKLGGDFNFSDDSSEEEEKTVP